MQTTNHVAARDEMFRALVAAPKDPHRNEPSGAAPRVPRAAFVSGAAIAAATVGLLSKLALREPRMALAMSAATLVVAGAARWQLARLFLPRTAYVMERRLGPLEIRRYETLVCAETTVEATTLERGSSKAFLRLLNYISSSGIAMTTPVVVARSDRPDSETLREWEVTEPRTTEGRFTMRFFLPANAIGALPSPKDDRVRLRELPGHRLVAMPFRGRTNGAAIVEAEKRLLSSARHALLTVRGEPMFAAHDAPTTLPWLRHNEVWINLA